MEKRKRSPIQLDASPQQKYENLILTFFEEWQEFQGHKIDFQKIFNSADLSHLGFGNQDEFIFYFSSLAENELIGPKPDKWSRNGVYDFPFSPFITYKGLNYCLSLLESGENSARCFVAMQFSNDMKPYYDEAILPAIKENGFISIRVDREHAPSDQSINDFIIANIKQSRFCIADITHQNQGVYFEMGYALGRGLKVIYTCREDDWENRHFDVQPLQTIKYSSIEQLRKELSLKIQAFIMD